MNGREKDPHSFLELFSDKNNISNMFIIESNVSKFALFTSTFKYSI